MPIPLSCIEIISFPDSFHVFTFSSRSSSAFLYFTALSIRLKITLVRCISSANITGSAASRFDVILPLYRSTFSAKVLITPEISSFASISFIFSVAFCRSNIDICSTFSTWKRKRLVSSFMTPDICWNICGDFATAGSFNICAASEIVDIGVLNSCVMLLTKSFFISVNFFWRNKI